MFNISVRSKKDDKYELTKSVKLVDVKGYLQKEYDRANEREDLIRELENEIERLNEISMKYDAMLVIQEETQKRIKKQDDLIKELRSKIKDKDDLIKLSKSQQIDVKVNAEKYLKEKDDEIKALKKQIKELTKTSTTNKASKTTKTSKKKKGVE